MENIYLSEETKKLVGYEVGSRLHEAWRESRNEDVNARLGREPRWKKTKDQQFIANVENSDVVRIGEIVEVDIANMTFTELPEDWKKDNLEAGLTAAKLTMGAVSREGTITSSSVLALTTNKVEELGDAIHEAWMARTEKGDWNAAQFVPYSELPREEQEKDLEHVRVVLKVIKEILIETLTLEELRNKYKDMDRNKVEEH